MNKIQYINYFKIKGIDTLPQGKSILDMMNTLGEPTINDMVEVNRLSMNYFIDENTKLKEENNKLESRVDNMADNVKLLHCLQSAGVDNWEGYDIAMDEYNGN